MADLTQPQNIFQVGGTMPANHPSYIHREADDQLFKLCQQNELAIILAARQMGKSSLIANTQAKLADTHQTVYLELNGILETGSSITTEFGLKAILAALIRELQLSGRLNLDQAWQQDLNYSNSYRFGLILREEILPAIQPKQLTIFMDEIDVLLRLDIKNDFFALLRGMYNQRSEYRGLSWVLAGVATPDQLISDPTRTSFNVGTVLHLNDFPKEHLAKYKTALSGKHGAKKSAAYFERIYQQTKGHPFLTQFLCGKVYDTPSAQANDHLVDHLIQQTFISPAVPNTHIEHIKRQILQSPQKARLLKQYRRIVGGQAPIRDDEQNEVINRLKLTGLVVADPQGYLQPRNPIYEQRFSEVWTIDELDQLQQQEQTVRLIGRYEYVPDSADATNNLIKHGQVASIYRALDIDTNKYVAIKILDGRSIKRDNDLANTFIRAAHNTARLDHPHIINILDIHRVEPGRNSLPFIVMDYIEGGTLRGRLRRDGQLPVPEAVQIIQQIGEALIYAHQQNLLHRDVNPNNIMLRKNGAAVLIDFEFAQVTAAYDLLKQLGSQSSIRGTTNYIPPEAGKKKPSPALDLFALGVTFYELLTGRPCYVKTLSPLDEPDYPPASVLRPELGPFFDALISRATHLEPEQRGSMTEFVEQLRRAEEQRQAVLQQIDQQATHTQLASLLGQWPNYLPLLRSQADLESNALETYRVHRQIVTLCKNAYQEAASYVLYLEERYGDRIGLNLQEFPVYQHATALLELTTRHYLEALTAQLRCGVAGNLWEQMLLEAEQFHIAYTTRNPAQFIDLQETLISEIEASTIEGKQIVLAHTVLQSIEGESLFDAQKIEQWRIGLEGKYQQSNQKLRAERDQARREQKSQIRVTWAVWWVSFIGFLFGVVY